MKTVKPEIGLQMFSVRNAFSEDMAGTLKRVREIGYSCVEFANPFGNPGAGCNDRVRMEQIRKVLDDQGIRNISNHIYPMPFDQIGRFAEYSHVLGAESVVECIGFYTDRDGVSRYAEELNRKGEKCAEYGLKLLYHNHFMEFQYFGDERVFDILLKETDPQYVSFEADLYWCYRGGITEPEMIVSSLGGRCPIIHLKDLPYTVPEPDIFQLIDGDIPVRMDVFEQFIGFENFTEVGCGQLDCEWIVKTLKTKTPIPCMIVEQDLTRLGEFESIELSYGNLSKWLSEPSEE